MSDIKVYCAEVGSVAMGKFAWYGGSSQNVGADISGTSMEELADHIANDINKGYPVALGFECPLFIPIRDDPKELTNARPGEGNRPWSANAGACVLATGLAQVGWLLNAIRSKLNEEKTMGFLDWNDFEGQGKGLFVWEAFVSGNAKGKNHIDDAKIAVNLFRNNLPNPINADIMAGQIVPGKIHSMVGAELIRCGWTEDTNMLSRQCIVLKA